MNEIEKAIKDLKDYIQLWEDEQADEDLTVIICKNTIESFKIAKQELEKQIPKKPIETVKIEPVIAENGAYVDADTYVLLLCPLCGERVGLDDLCDKFCRECGQAIDWAEEVEE